MNNTLNDMYNVLPQMQKIVLCSTEKISLIEEILADYEEKIEDLNRRKEEMDNKLKDMDLKIQDFNIADLLKSNTGAIEGGQEEGGGVNNNLVLNLISNLEKKFNAKSKATDERLNKLEETNFKLSKETQNLKNAQDGNKRTLNNMKQINDDLISNMKNLENKIVETIPDMAKKFESQIKLINKEKT